MANSNILLIGCPGAGKTTVGMIVAKLLEMKFIDFDSDILEKVWGMKVADKLKALGSDQFIETEGEVFLQLEASKSVISLSGSTPMYTHFKPHAQSLGRIFFLDVSHEDILKYLNKKTTDETNAIVGKYQGMTWADIIEYRQQFYVHNYDTRIICEPEEAPASIAAKLVKLWRHLEGNNGYKSTRSLVLEEKEKSFFDVVIEGLAQDGGLYIPYGGIPYFTAGQLQRLIPLSYTDRAAMILEAWIDPTELHPSHLYHMIRQAFSSFEDEHVAPVRKIDDRIYIQELFHGPTASFKDLALQLMPLIFDEAVANERRKGSSEKVKYLMLVATSGDTGSAVLHGFKDCYNVAVMVFYPKKGISETQRRQMTSMRAKNIKVIGIDGDFDFCQTTVKQIFTDKDFATKVLDSYGYKLSAANSINWGRLLPQVVYHMSAYLDLVKQGEISFGEPIDICVPTGNFGNILAAFYAKEMGVPFQTLICASNSNNILHEFLSTGKYDMRERQLQRTISPSIDILKSSNLERFLFHMTKDSDYIRTLFQQLSREKFFQIPKSLLEQIGSIVESGWVNDDESKKTIRTFYENKHYLLDPHTAVAVNVAIKRESLRKVIVSGTAHYGKFGKDVLLALDMALESESPREILKQLDELQVEPKMNKSLKKSMVQNEVQSNYCERNLEMVKGIIFDFLKQLQHV